MNSSFEGRTDTGKDEWLTPPEIIEALGVFDLDPCAPGNPPWPTAKKSYCIIEDGLSAAWSGRVWLNPPYGREMANWLNKLSKHGDGIAFIFARTDTAAFHKYVFEKADAVLFLLGRTFFYHVDGSRAKLSAGAPSCLVAYGSENVEALENCKLPGKLIHLNFF
jgi:hypothetical protein